MGNQPGEKREKAWKMYKRARGEKSLTDIARVLNVSPSTVRGWKFKDGWDHKLEELKNVAPHKGGQKGNKNAQGNRGGGDPQGLNALRHGAYATRLGAAMREEERDVFAEDGYSQNVLDAMRLEVNAINVKQLRLMTRLTALRDKLEQLEQLHADAEETAPVTREIYTIETALDRAGGRKVKLLQLLYEATDMQRDVEVVFGGFAPGVPEHDAGDGEST